jgi:hypothetical protein
VERGEGRRGEGHPAHGGHATRERGDGEGQHREQRGLYERGGDGVVPEEPVHRREEEGLPRRTKRGGAVSAFETPAVEERDPEAIVVRLVVETRRLPSEANQHGACNEPGDRREGHPPGREP